MTRRLTVGTRSEMGLITDTTDHQPASLNWTPIKTDFWRKPSKWQICMPRLRMVAKALGSCCLLVILLKILNDQPRRSERAPPPTEEEQIEAAKREDWMWKDYPTYDTRSPMAFCRRGQHC